MLLADLEAMREKAVSPEALRALAEKWREESADDAERANRAHYGGVGCSAEFIAYVRQFARENCPRANELESLLTASEPQGEEPTTLHRELRKRGIDPQGDAKETR
jgi:hypothetical protein